jgi:nicotinamide-nucleotide amidase
MWMQGSKAVFVSLPGVPFEMKHLFLDELKPLILSSFDRPVLLQRTLITYGLGESAIAERIADWEDALPAHAKLAYLPNLGRVRLRISMSGSNLNTLDQELNALTISLKSRISDILFGEEDGEALEETLRNSFTQRSMTLSTAESFTGGRIASQLTAVSGASQYFKGGIVSYATEVKTGILQIPGELVLKHSVVSAEVACAMAEKVRSLLHTDIGIATTGNAGPDKGDSDSEIGRVFIGISSPASSYAVEFNMGNHRERVVQKSVHKAMELLQQEILKF